MDINEIMEVIPHRAPFLFLDKVIKSDKKSLICEWEIRETDFFLSGHFPQRPIVPGAIMVEAMAQGVSLLVLLGENKKMLPYLLSIEKVKFLKPATVGDILTIEVILKRKIGRIFVAEGSIKVKENLICEGIISGSTMDL